MKSRNTLVIVIAIQQLVLILANYDWESWTHYEILEIDAKSTEIKKAYRKQAQLWHPDKLRHNETVDVEESNARFARIAEAYDTLSDPIKRQEYDLQLSRGTQRDYWRNQGGDAQSAPQQMKEEQMDPFKLFREFFFDEPEDNFYDPFFHNQYYKQSPYEEARFYASQHSPDRLSSEQQLLSADGTSRILETTSYFLPDGKTVYVRTRGQDFYSDMYGRLYSQPPRLLQDVLIHQSSSTMAKPKHDASIMADPAVLWQGMNIVAGGTMRNNGYTMRMDSFSCEMQIIHSNGDDSPVQVLWSTARESRYYRQSLGECQLQWQDSYLVVTSYDSALWTPTTDPYARANPKTLGHLSRLDEDGALAIYRIDTPSLGAHWLATLWRETILLDVHSSRTPQWRRGLTLAVPKQVWYFMWSMVLGGRLWRMPKSSQVGKAVCESASGSPFGCLRIGRRLFQIYRDVKHIVGKLISFFDRLLDDV